MKFRSKLFGCMNHAWVYLILTVVICACSTRPRSQPEDKPEPPINDVNQAETLIKAAESDPIKAFHASVEKAKADYRGDVAKLFEGADRVELCAVKYDGTYEGIVDLPYEDQWIRMNPRPTHSHVSIIKSRFLTKDESKEFLTVFGKQLAKREYEARGHGGHYPSHGVRIYKGDDLLHEGSFSWISGNFTFNYPYGSGLPLYSFFHPTTHELKAVCNRLLPVPLEEIQRIKKQHPGFLAGIIPLPESPPLKPDEKEVRIGGQTYSVPKSYKHIELQGEDTAVGKLLIPEPKLEVGYDIGMLAATPRKLDDLPPEIRSSFVHFERVFYEGGWAGIERYYILCSPTPDGGYRMSMVFPLYHAFFSTYFDGYDNITPVRNALVKIAIRHSQKKK